MIQETQENPNCAGKGLLAFTRATSGERRQRSHSRGTKLRQQLPHRHTAPGICCSATRIQMQERVPLPNHSVNPREFSLNQDRLICCKFDEIISKFPFNRCQLFLHLLRAACTTLRTSAQLLE